MRQLRRLLSVLVMAVTIVGMSVTAFAQESVSGAGGNGSITIENASKGIHYPILFTAMPCEVAESHMITVF